MIKGFILSAGLGERLRPITSQIPKPMLPILGRPIIDYAIEKLLSIEGIRLGFNLHYKSNIISSWLMSHKNHNLFEMFYEPTILGTGGALKNAEDFLKGSELFITYNGDVYSDFDIS
ncbi:MAG: sugar phosphate nucleotidyltransferase, partial [Thermodesulfovibrionales bacterium]|nr:sugar phosphate nucleotidyltransferase [Thermodesulfovibrionales bacterium]